MPHVPYGAEEEPLQEKARNADQRGQSGVTSYEQLLKSLITAHEETTWVPVAATQHITNTTETT
jgi:hypothetical protein